MNEHGGDSRFIDHLLFRSLKGEAAPSEQEKVLEWRESSADNELYYRELEALLELTADAYNSLNAEISEPPRAAEILRAAPNRSGRLAGRFASSPGWAPWLRTGLAVGALAALVVFVLPSEPFQKPLPEELLGMGVDEFATGSSDVATVQLRDGTVVRLAPQSRLRLTGSPGERAVTLEGRAYFAVANVEGRPFTVRTGGGDAVVLGTRFEAETRGQELRLLVVEGSVALSTAGSLLELGAGEMARSIEGAVSAPVKVPDPSAILEWTGNFLVFQRTPLDQVRAEIQRHFDLPIEIVGDATPSVTAWFADPTAEDVIWVVCRVLAARCSIEDGKATIDVTGSNQSG